MQGMGYTPCSPRAAAASQFVDSIAVQALARTIIRLIFLSEYY